MIAQPTGSLSVHHMEQCGERRRTTRSQKRVKSGTFFFCSQPGCVSHAGVLKRHLGEAPGRRCRAQAARHPAPEPKRAPVRAQAGGRLEPSRGQLCRCAEERLLLRWSTPLVHEPARLCEVEERHLCGQKQVESATSELSTPLSRRQRARAPGSERLGTQWPLRFPWECRALGLPGAHRGGAAAELGPRPRRARPRCAAHGSMFRARRSVHQRSYRASAASSKTPSAGSIRLHSTEKRNEPSPSCSISGRSTSSNKFHMSHARPHSSPFRIVSPPPRLVFCCSHRFQFVSTMPPSTWYADVAEPKMKPGGNWSAAAAAMASSVVATSSGSDWLPSSCVTIGRSGLRPKTILPWTVPEKASRLCK